MRVGKKKLPAVKRSKSVIVSSTTPYGAGVDLRKGLLPRRARTAALATLRQFYTVHPDENRARSRSLVRRRVVRASSAPVRRSAALPIAPPSAGLKRSVSDDSSASRSRSRSRSPDNRRRTRTAVKKSAGRRRAVPKTNKGRRTRTAKQTRAKDSKSKGGSAHRAQFSNIEQKADKATKSAQSSDVEVTKGAQSSDVEQKADKAIKGSQSSDVEQKADSATKGAQSSDVEQKVDKAIKGAQSVKKATRAAKSRMRGVGC